MDEIKIGDREIRTFVLAELRIAGDKPKIEGYAAVFNQLSEPLWGFREKIRPGAFAKTIKESDIRALFNHDPNYVLGRKKNGSLSLVEDEKGLRISINPPATQWATDLVESIRRGDVDQMSFGFTTIKDEWTYAETKADDTIRELVEVRLFDISPVTFPAYPQTTVGVRSIIEKIAEPQEAGHSAGHSKEPTTEPPTWKHSLADKEKKLRVIEKLTEVK